MALHPYTYIYIYISLSPSKEPLYGLVSISSFRVELQPFSRAFTGLVVALQPTSLG